MFAYLTTANPQFWNRIALFNVTKIGCISAIVFATVVAMAVVSTSIKMASIALVFAPSHSQSAHAIGLCDGLPSNHIAQENK